MPLETGTFVGSLGFYDGRVGEFYYEVVGEATSPTPLETHKVQCKVEEMQTKDIVLPFRNVQFEKAKQWLESGARAGSVPLGRLKQLPESITYDVRVTSPFYQAPKQITISQLQPTAPAASSAAPAGPAKKTTAGAKAAEKKDAAAAATADLNTEKLALEFRPREPGVYPCSVILTSAIDMRIYSIEGTGTAPNSRVALTFNTHARREVVQSIPIVNPTDKDWPIKATFKQDGLAFDGPREFIAKKRSANGQATTSNYPLTFRPEWICDVKAHLQLDNIPSKESYEYELHGVAEEPLSVDHRVVQCEARVKTTEMFEVHNHFPHQVTFDVESDLLHICGAPTVTVDGKGAEQYELGFQPLQAGIVTGCVMFRDPGTGQYTWYTVELHVSPPKPQQALTLQCVVRQAVAMDIELTNPLDDVIVFDVRLHGEGLLGMEQFVLAPRESATYELVYSPLLPCAPIKGTAVFLNERVGEFWYDLILTAEPAPPEDLPLLECEVGRSMQHKISIENPTGHEVVLKPKSSNKINFRVVAPSRIVMAPLEGVEVTLEYSPSSLDTQEEAELTFENPEVGLWIYRAKGVGLPPKEPRKVSVVSQVHKATSSTISFKNPFLESVQAMVVLETSSERGVFTLLQKKAKTTIQPLGMAQIPFSFCPTSMTQHTARVTVIVGHLIWAYDVTGVAEAPPDTTQHVFSCAAREEIDQYYPLTLVGLDLPFAEFQNQLTVDLEVPPGLQTLVNKVCRIGLADPADPTVEATIGAKSDRIALHVKLRPLRPFTALCNLVVHQAGAGRWRFDVKIDVAEPEVDDLIVIESPLNKSASVAFRLTNATAAYAEFEAYFAADSAYEFAVSPTSGVLEPAGKQGTPFVITYRPTEYGKPVTGRLIIQTEDVFWSYAVKGSIPKYSAPTVDVPRVSTRLTREMQSQLANANQAGQKKNFIRSNLQVQQAQRR